MSADLEHGDNTGDNAVENAIEAPVTGAVEATTTPEVLVNGSVEVVSTRCACGRWPQRGRVVCWFCDPLVTPEAKREARTRRRTLVLEDVDLGTPAGRQELREAITAAVLRKEVQPGEAQAALAAIRDHERADEARRVPAKTTSRIFDDIDITKYGVEPNGETG